MLSGIATQLVPGGGEPISTAWPGGSRKGRDRQVPSRWLEKRALAARGVSRKGKPMTSWLGQWPMTSPGGQGARPASYLGNRLLARHNS